MENSSPEVGSGRIRNREEEVRVVRKGRGWTTRKSYNSGRVTTLIFFQVLPTVFGTNRTARPFARYNTRAAVTDSFVVKRKNQNAQGRCSG